MLYGVAGLAAGTVYDVAQSAVKTGIKRGSEELGELVRTGYKRAKAAFIGPKQAQTRSAFKNNQNGMPGSVVRHRKHTVSRSTRRRKTKKVVRKKRGRPIGRVTKRKRRRTGGLKTHPGPKAHVEYFLPTAYIGPYYVNKYFDPYDGVNSVYVKSGAVQSLPNEENTVFYPVLSATQILGTMTFAQAATESDNTIVGKGIFNPATLGGFDTTTGNAILVRNYLKAYERFRITRCKVTLFLTNHNPRNCRVWIDVSTCKSWTDTALHEDLGTAFAAQDAFQGLDAATAPTLPNLIKDVRTDIKKIPGLAHWKRMINRKELYLIPGAEIKVEYVFKNLIWDGKQHGFQSGNANDFIPNVSKYFAITTRGLTGQSLDVTEPSGFTESNVATQMKIELDGYREDVMNMRPFQYVPNMSPYLPVPNVIAPTSYQIGTVAPY